jgi:haloalkane dehalogenase
MKDWCFTPEFLKEFQQRFPQAETAAFAEAGHYVFEDAREHLPGVIREFLGKHPLPGE